MAYSDNSMEDYAVVVTTLCQLCKVLAGLPVQRSTFTGQERSLNLKISHRLRIARKGDILEEHDPSKALVGCYLDSFLGRLILLLAYCHCVLEEK